MCKLCDRDKAVKSELDIKWPMAWTSKDRLAVLEKDHQAMEKVRAEGLSLGYWGDNQWAVLKDGYCKPINDPADAILAVEK